MSSTANSLLPFHKQFPDKFRSQTLFGQYEKIYRRPPTLKKNTKEFVKLQSEEKAKLSKVIDFRNIANNELSHQQHITLIASQKHLNLYGYSTLSGLYFIPNYLSTAQQFEWTKRSIQQFSNAPYNNLSNLHAQQNDSRSLPTWQQAVKDNDFSQFRQLTWCNVGIQYDWTERVYNLDKITSPIPASMSKLCEDCNALLADIETLDDEQKTCTNGKDENGLTLSMSMVPQTSIINFFQVNSKRPMGGHRDAAELINAPLISVSLGNEAIFLISQHDNVEPLALYIRSGDVLIMAGDARFALHCVARVVPNTCPNELAAYFDAEIEKAAESGKAELRLMKKYMLESRINFNIRQVIDEDKLPQKRSDHEIQTYEFHEIHSF